MRQWKSGFSGKVQPTRLMMTWAAQCPARMHSSSICSWTNAERNPGQTAEERSARSSWVNASLIKGGERTRPRRQLVTKVNSKCARKSSCEGDGFPSVPPTKASPAPFVSTMSFWSMSRTGNMVTLSPTGQETWWLLTEVLANSLPDAFNIHFHTRRL